MERERTTEGEAWRQLCERLADLGEEILGPDYPGGERARVDGFRHLANQTSAWLEWAIGYPVEQPAFFRQNDLVVRWGGPNVDQTSRRARIDPTGTYVLRGTMGSADDFIVTLKNGDMFLDKYGVSAEVMASELGYGPGDEVEIFLGGEPRPERWLAIPDSARLCNIREYYWNWEPQLPATFVLERVDTRGTTPRPVDPERLAAMLDEAATMVEGSVRYWNRYMADAKAGLEPNRMGPPSSQAGGSSRIAYSFGFFELGPDEALLIEADPSEARYWDVQLYNMGWFESLDFANRPTSLNHTQGWVHPDGRFRAVLAPVDPGVPNWLDSEGRADGMCTFRWVAPAGTTVGTPSISSVVVPVAEVGDHLPAGTPVVSAEQRRAQIAARQAHLAWRYRT